MRKKVVSSSFRRKKVSPKKPIDSPFISSLRGPSEVVSGDDEHAVRVRKKNETHQVECPEKVFSVPHDLHPSKIPD